MLDTSAGASCSHTEALNWSGHALKAPDEYELDLKKKKRRGQAECIKIPDKCTYSKFLPHKTDSMENIPSGVS